MNNSQKILVAIGGVTVLAALVIGYFIWGATSVNSELQEDIDGGIAGAGRIMKKLPMNRTSKDIGIYDANAASNDEWRVQAMKLASEGDQVYEATTEAALKAQLVADAHRFAELPGSANGKLVKADFGFGFADYITGGKLPAKSDLSRIQREWNDVSTVLSVIAESGALEIVDVRIGAAKAAEDEQVDAKAKARGKKGRQKQKAAAKEGTSERDPFVTRFEVDFLSRPPAFVKAVDAFATHKRFVVVDDFSFVRTADAIQTVLGAGDRKEERSGGSRRRRRGRSEAQNDVKNEVVGSGVVTDPASEPPMKVTMKFSVYDFRSLELDKEEVK